VCVCSLFKAVKAEHISSTPCEFTVPVFILIAYLS